MYAAISDLLLAALLALANAQQVYIPAQGPTPRPFCESNPAPPNPTYRFSSFSFTLNETVRTATSIPAPTTTSTYAAGYEAVSHWVPSLSTTTWGSWDPNDTATATDTANPYGTAAWSALWDRANVTNFTATGIYSTTVNPTPVASSELVLPPPDYFGPTDCYNFPEDFIFGVAGSASQIEGAVAQQGRGPTLMEVLVTGSNARDFVTNENYYLYKQDIERIASMGVKYYSFSIAWTRILPFALPGTPVNQEGIDHYNDLINFVLEKGMAPIVTIFHFDTPLQFFGNLSTVHDDALIGYVNGGYQNESFEDAFVNYGKIVLTHYANRVPFWMSFNEPLLYSDNGKSIDSVVKAHARLWHFYHDDLNATGEFGIKLNDNFGVPRDPKNQSDVFAANWFNEFQLGTFCNPLMLGIDYPDSYKETIPDYVPLTPSDLAFLKGTADFLGIDPYTATVVSPPSYGIQACAANTSDPLFPYCVNQSTTTTNGWNIGYRSYSYVYITPTYLRKYLSYLYNTWQTPVFVTEFGFPVFGEADKAVLGDMLFDTPRSIYYLSFMSEILKSIWEDGVHVIGALAWSFADNWEFGDYDARFGLQTVNRTTQERRYKKSFFDLVDFINARMSKGD
ncbi:glycoside hydrolase family 1 protein [Lepidopterella palustris CBS 459.81]|uniref:Glycoside hydrolase family 1 protein n=1 Tax=Lepidopterella palustris CBS 459.81 TaxID=1314670 RepID=A0A8E2JK51_9PEZI|nr:glycoside hydrolase family 1 protein [Lepidopterella palustris CBS 459.81]